MKIRINKWLGCGLALMIALGLNCSIHHVNAQQNSTNNQSTPTIQPIASKQTSNRNGNQTTVAQVTSIPNQGYTNYVTGRRALYSLPGTVKGAHVIYGRRAMRRFARQHVRFMTYQRATTSKGLIYYKIVSLHHSVRGWMYQTAIQSMLNRKQQVADFTFGSQITHAEMVADQSKHESLVNNTAVNLKDARSIMKQASASVQSLKGTPDYKAARASLRAGQRYLRQIKKIQPSSKTLTGLESIRSEYDQAAQAVSDAQTASLNHQTVDANKDIKVANQSLKQVSHILSQINNRHDRKVAMNLFNQAMSYVNSNFSFDPATELSGKNLGNRKMSNDQLVNLITTYETDAQNAIMDLYPNLNNFDVTLMDAYRAQNDLNQANDLVNSLKGAHVRSAELDDIKLNQHNINNLWNV